MRDVHEKRREEEEKEKRERRKNVKIDVIRRQTKRNRAKVTSKVTTAPTRQAKLQIQLQQIEQT